MFMQQRSCLYPDPASPIASCRQPQTRRTRGFVAAKVVAEKVASVSRKDHSTGPKNMFSQPRVHEYNSNDCEWCSTLAVDWSCFGTFTGHNARNTATPTSTVAESAQVTDSVGLDMTLSQHVRVHQYDTSCCGIYHDHAHTTTTRPVVEFTMTMPLLHDANPETRDPWNMSCCTAW